MFMALVAVCQAYAEVPRPQDSSHHSMSGLAGSFTYCPKFRLADCARYSVLLLMTSASQAVSMRQGGAAQRSAPGCGAVDCPFVTLMSSIQWLVGRSCGEEGVGTKITDYLLQGPFIIPCTAYLVYILRNRS